MNKLLLLLVGFTVVLSGKAQQVPFYNHYVVNPFVYNPSMAGFSGNVNAYFVRNQRYSQFNGGSINNYLTVEGSIMNDKAGLGLTVIHQKQGIQQQLGAGLTYAYRIRLAETQDLRFGVTGGILDNRMDLSAINVSQNDDPYLMGLRPNITAFDFNAGLTYRWNTLKIGVAVPQLVGNKVTYSKDYARGYYQLARHIMGSAEYDFQLTQNKQLILKPQALVRYIPGAPFQYDLTAHLEHQRFGWISATYKSDYAVQFNIGVHVRKQLHVGFSYEYLIASMKNYSTGVNHEIAIGYTFPVKTREVPYEVKIHDTVRIEDRTTADELLRRNQELEALLQKNLEEKLALEAEKNKTDSLLKAKQERHEVLERPVETAISDKDKLEYARGYHFIELDDTDSPDGIYVISGVFSSRKNADRTMEKNKPEYPNTYLIKNQKNGYFYVVILYTQDEPLARNEYRSYVKRTKEKAWILKYRKE